MWSKRTVRSLVLAAGALSVVAGAAAAATQSPRAEVSLMGGIQALNKNDTAFPDRFINIPAVVSAAYHATPLLAVEGEFTWIIPVTQNVDLGSTSEDRKLPNVLAYQANLRVDLPREAWSPYVTAGAGAMTFLSSTDADRVPQTTESQTAFAINFGAGATYRVTDRWGIRADVREFVAFPSDTAAGLSDGTSADTIWMERGTVGLAVAF